MPTALLLQTDCMSRLFLKQKRNIGTFTLQQKCKRNKHIYFKNCTKYGERRIYKNNFREKIKNLCQEHKKVKSNPVLIWWQQLPPLRQQALASGQSEKEVMIESLRSVRVSS